MSRTARVLAVLGLVLLVGVVIGVAAGPAGLGIERLAPALVGRGDSVSRVVVWELRLPRVVAAMVAGACLGVAGFLIQGSTRNPLGDPQLFGLSGGAAIVQAFALAGTVEAGRLGLTTLSVLASLAGAGLIAFFASRREISAARLALIGVSVAALSAAVATGILAQARVFTQQSLAFLGGSLAARGWPDTVAALPFLAAGLLLALPAIRTLNLFALGDSVAANLGGDPRRTRAMAMGAAGVLAGAAASLAGLVGFVGLLVPHVARLLVGHDARAMFLAVVPLGAAVTLYADQAARLVFMPSEVPAGLFTALIGAPLMIVVARRVR